mmetsp:Transcript_77209/g.216758  ORF Transcript_77209/g.216758 Transcript_77209/m.216758 type:complete len:261 (+) Transcript_77209:105-887(+)
MAPVEATPTAAAAASLAAASAAAAPRAAREAAASATWAAASAASASASGPGAKCPMGARKARASGQRLWISSKVSSNSSRSFTTSSKLSTADASSEPPSRPPGAALPASGSAPAPASACSPRNSASRSSASSRTTARASSCRSRLRRCARWAWRSVSRAASTAHLPASRWSHCACKAFDCFDRASTLQRRSVLSSSVVSFRREAFSSFKVFTSARKLCNSLSCILIRSLKCTATSSAMPCRAIAPETEPASPAAPWPSQI